MFISRAEVTGTDLTRHGPGQRGQPGEVGGFLRWAATVTHGKLGGRAGGRKRKQLGQGMSEEGCWLCLFLPP